MKLTDELLEELQRCVRKLEDYRKNPGNWNSSRTHASLHRGTLDLSKILSKWRKTRKPIGEKEEYK